MKYHEEEQRGAAGQSGLGANVSKRLSAVPVLTDTELLDLFRLMDASASGKINAVDFARFVDEDGGKRRREEPAGQAFNASRPPPLRTAAPPPKPINSK
eukprot:SAG11_NODE_1831_length_4191_cov_4.013930_3_plen_99_part_00